MKNAHIHDGREDERYTRFVNTGDDRDAIHSIYLQG